MNFVQYWFPLAVGLFLAMAGLRFLLVHPNRIAVKGNAQRPSTFASRLLGFVLFCVGAAIVIGLLVSMPPWRRTRAVNALLRTTPAQVHLVVLRPASATFATPGLRDSLSIRSRQDVDAIVTALNSAEALSPNHPQTKWSALLSLPEVEKDAEIEVDVDGTGRNGTVLWIKAKGWIIGTYRCDALRPAIENAIGRVQQSSEARGESSKQDRSQ